MLIKLNIKITYHIDVVSKATPPLWTERLTVWGLLCLYLAEMVEVLTFYLNLSLLIFTCRLPREYPPIYRQQNLEQLAKSSSKCLSYPVKWWRKGAVFKNILLGFNVWFQDSQNMNWRQDMFSLYKGYASTHFFLKQIYQSITSDRWIRLFILMLFVWHEFRTSYSHLLLYTLLSTSWFQNKNQERFIEVTCFHHDWANMNRSLSYCIKYWKMKCINKFNLHSL